MFQLTQNTDDWLQFRKSKIGASDAPIIMGDSPWSTPHQLWQQKLGLIEPKKKNIAMQWGIDNEQHARSLFRAHTDIEVLPTVLIHPGIYWMMASMDGVSEDRRIGVEIKCPGAADHESAKKHIVPTKYYAQLQHQHAVGCFDQLFYASLGRDNSFVLFEVPRDDKYIAKLIEREGEFYDCICNFESPDFHGGNFDIRFDDDFKEAAQSWIDIKEKIKDLEDKEAEIRESILAMSNGNPAKGHGIKVSSFVRKGSVDFVNLPDELSKKIDIYRKPSTTCWRIQKYNE